MAEYHTNIMLFDLAVSITTPHQPRENRIGGGGGGGGERGGYSGVLVMGLCK